jgi:hypothetical protein
MRCLHDSSIRIPAIRTGSLVLTLRVLLTTCSKELRLHLGQIGSVWKEGDTGAVETAVSFSPFPFLLLEFYCPNVPAGYVRS